jgi:hypothetical protein
MNPLDISLDVLNLSARCKNALEIGYPEVKTVGDVLRLSDQELLRLRSFGRLSLGELRSKCAEVIETNADSLNHPSPMTPATRRRERLEVASRIAAGAISNGFLRHVAGLIRESEEQMTEEQIADATNYQLVVRSLAIADALIAAVDAEPAKPASEVQFKPEGGAS